MKRQIDFCNGWCYRHTCDGDLEKCCYLVEDKCYVMENEE